MTRAGPLSRRQLRALGVLEEALMEAGDQFPLGHAAAVVSGPHWLRLIAALVALDPADEEEGPA